MRKLEEAQTVLSKELCRTKELRVKFAFLSLVFQHLLSDAERESENEIEVVELRV